MIHFSHRTDAGIQLAPHLLAYKQTPDTIVIGIPRGGVVLAHEVAKALQLPLDVIVTRKITPPLNDEVAIGAVTEENELLLDDRSRSFYDITETYLTEITAEAKKEITRRLQIYRKDRPPLHLTGKTVLLVDDGIATGHTMLAAIASAYKKGASKVIVAVPVIAHDIVSPIKEAADDLIYLFAPRIFGSVGAFYDRFDQVTNEEVMTFLKK